MLKMSKSFIDLVLKESASNVIIFEDGYALKQHKVVIKDDNKILSTHVQKKLIDSKLNIIESSDVFLTQLETPKEVTLYAIKKAKNFNCTTILNPAPASEITDDNFQYFDFFTPNETEASFYYGQSIKNEEDCKKAGSFFLDKGIKNIIITLGENGCYFKNNKEEFIVPASNLKKPVVDTTGAGDAFNGALSVAISQNKNYKEAIELANLVAGLSVTREGAANSMPYKKELF